MTTQVPQRSDSKGGRWGSWLTPALGTNMCALLPSAIGGLNVNDSFFSLFFLSKVILGHILLQTGLFLVKAMAAVMRNLLNLLD